MINHQLILSTKTKNGHSKYLEVEVKLIFTFGFLTEQASTSSFVNSITPLSEPELLAGLLFGAGSCPPFTTEKLN